MDIPLVDYHVHLGSGLSLERAMELSQERGVQFGIVEHGGRGQVLGDDEDVTRYAQRLEGYPVYKGMQAEGLDWADCFSTDAVAQLDYVLSDALTFPEEDGRRVRLWTPEATVKDPQDFMDRYVAFNVQVISEEPIDILGNPTFLPAPIVADYDLLWTPVRMARVIEAALQHDVAIEINARYRIPSEAFIRIGKEAGLKFSFGSNEHSERVGILDYPLQMARECGLTRAHLFAPKPPGEKPIQKRPWAATGPTMQMSRS